MFPSFVIVFREVLEAGLVVGIVLAAAQGLRGRNLFVSAGVAIGVAGACIVAAFADLIGRAFAGDGQEVFNASVLGIAILMLGWHNIWMAKHGRALQQEMKSVGHAVAMGHKSLYALAVVVGLAVLREGSEVVLFLYGISLSGKETVASMATGGVLGIVAGAAVALVIYFGLVRVPMRNLFKVTSILIAFLAAGMASQAIAFLAQAGLLLKGQAELWNTSAYLADSSMIGRTLHVLVGYTDQPSEAQLIAYIVTLTTILGLGKVVNGSSQRTVTRTKTAKSPMKLSAAS